MPTVVRELLFTGHLLRNYSSLASQLYGHVTQNVFPQAFGIKTACFERGWNLMLCVKRVDAHTDRDVSTCPRHIVSLPSISFSPPETVLGHLYRLAVQSCVVSNTFYLQR